MIRSNVFTNTLSGVTAHDVERIVQSVLRDYGLRMRIHDVGRLTDSWDIVLDRRDGSALHIAVATSSPHGVRRALMSALKIDG